MNRRDDLAATAARNLQHVDRLRALYRGAVASNPDAAALRGDMIAAARALGPAAERLDTPAQAEEFVTRLRGMVTLALRLRDAAKGDG